MELINKKKITIEDKIFACIYIIIVSIFMVSLNIKLTDVTPIFLILPIIVTITFIIHEVIHIALYKILNNEAKIKVIRDKDMKAWIMYQSNENAWYSTNQTILILIAPCLIITIASLLILPHFEYLSLIIKVNMILNCFSSITDMTVTHRLIRKYSHKNIKIFYQYDKLDGVSMIIK